jgi:hypothetical protein
LPVHVQDVHFHLLAHAQHLAWMSHTLPIWL